MNLYVMIHSILPNVPVLLEENSEQERKHFTEATINTWILLMLASTHTKITSYTDITVLPQGCETIGVTGVRTQSTREFI